MAEPNAAAGRTPAMGSGSSASPAAASRIRVDVSDVTKLKTAIKDTTTEAKKLGDAIGAFDTKLAAVKKASTAIAEMQRLLRGSGVSGTRPGPTTVVTAGQGGVGAANQNAGTVSGTPGPGVGGGPGSSYMDVFFPSAPNQPVAKVAAPSSGGMGSRVRSWFTPQQPQGGGSGGGGSYNPQGTFSGQPGGGSRGPALNTWATTPAYRTVQSVAGGLSSIASLGSGHLGAATERSYMLNRYQLTTGGATTTAAQTTLGSKLTGYMGNTALNYQDVTTAAGTLSQTGVMGGAYGQSRFSGVGFLSTLNPLQGNATSAAQMAQTFTSQNYYAMRLAGVNASIANGQNIQSLFDQIIRRIEGQMGRKATLTEIQSGAQQGTHLNADLTAMGLSPAMVGQLITYWAAKNRGGLQASGALNNLGRSGQQMGSQQAFATAQVDKGYIGGAEASERGMATAYHAAGALAGTGAGQMFTKVTGDLTAFSGALTRATHLLETLAGLRIAGALLSGGTGGGILGGLLGGEGAVGGAGALGVLKTLGLAGLSVGGGLLAGKGLDLLGKKTGHRSTGTIAGDAARGAGIGAGIGLLGGPFAEISVPVGAGVGATVGAAWGARHGIASAAHSAGSFVTGLFGGSSNSSSGPPQPSSAIPGGGGSGASMAEVAKIIHSAEQYLGTPYRWGGASPRTGFDCSGLTQWAYKQGGVSIPRVAAAQQKFAKRISPNQVTAGDLLFLGNPAHHVMMSIGGGKVIQAPHTGARVDIINFPATAATTVGRIIGGVGSNAVFNPNDSAGGDSGDTQNQTGMSGATSASFLGDLFSTSSADALLGALGALGGFTAGATSSNTGGGGGGGSGGSGGGTSNYTYTGRGSVSEKNMYALAQAAGFTNAQARIMAAIGMAESSGNTRSHNTNTATGDNSYGLWQINMLGSMGPSRAKEFGINSYNQLFDPKTNAHAARMIFGGSGFNAWSTYKDGAYRKFLNSYDRGSWEIVRDELAQLHKGEMVVPAQPAAAIRHEVSAAGGQGSGRRKTVPVQLVFYVQHGTEHEARQHAARFAKYAAEDHDIEMVALS